MDVQLRPLSTTNQIYVYCCFIVGGKTGITGEKHCPTNFIYLSHNVVSSTPRYRKQPNSLL